VWIACFVLATLYFHLFPSNALAGAWTLPARRGQAILTFSMFETSRTYDAAGVTRAFTDGGRFRQVILNPYMEYGLTSRNTLVLNTQVPFLDFNNDFGAQHSAGLGDTEIGLRRRVNSPDSPWAISTQFAVKFPLYPADRNPAPGNHQDDVELRVMVGRGMTLLSRHAFWDWQLAYRSRFGAPADQVRSDLTVGVDMAPRLMAMAQVFSIRGMRNGQPVDAISNPNARSDFDLYQCRLTMVFRVATEVRLQAGWNGALAGRNTGRGNTAILALWKDFGADR
jgi:protein XagA